MIKRFNRFELKYIIPSSTKDALMSELRSHVTPDPEGGPIGTYGITSLYYDSPDFACFRAKINGIRFRRKVRIRRYSGGDVAVEIKQRINRTTQKRRLEGSLDQAYALCAGLSPNHWSDPRDAAVASEIEFLVRSLLLRPTCVIGYVRQAFMGSRYEPGLRVTFDHGLWASTAAHGLSDEGARHSILPPHWVIMEVKANNAIPLWVSHLLARHHVLLNRFSKYCAGLSTLHALLLSTPSPVSPDWAHLKQPGENHG